MRNDIANKSRNAFHLAIQSANGSRDAVFQKYLSVGESS